MTGGPAAPAVRTLALDGVDPCILDRLAERVGPDERARAARFARAGDRRAHLAAHALKRWMLSQAAPSIAPWDWRFVIGPHGKPELADHVGVWFNLSHCDGLVACAISRSGAVGLDVECTGRPAPLEIAEGQFAAGERDWLRGLPDAARPDGFFRLWTLKEAVIKATGLGLEQPLAGFTLALDPPRIVSADAAIGDPADWRLAQARLGDRHLLALAWRGGPAADACPSLTPTRPESLLGG